MITLRRICRSWVALAAIAAAVGGCAVEGASKGTEVHAAPTAADVATIHELTRGRWWQTMYWCSYEPGNRSLGYTRTLRDAMRLSATYHEFRASGNGVADVEIANRDFTLGERVVLRGDTVSTDSVMFVDGRRVTRPPHA